MIETELTDDKNIMNFYPRVQILATGFSDFKDANSGQKSALAEAIFAIDNIVSVFITPDMVSVTKGINAEWEELKPQVLAEIKDFIELNKQVISEPTTDVSATIVGLINARIRPVIKRDGGDIIFHGFKNGVVYVELTGKCISCPYSMITLKEGVEKILKYYIPEVESVENAIRGE